MLKDGQRSLNKEIEDTTSCCEDHDCQYPTWMGTKCGRCGKPCSEKCYHYLGAWNRLQQENRWYLGKFLVRRMPKDDNLPPDIARYLALEDNPRFKTGQRLELKIVDCRKEKKI